MRALTISVLVATVAVASGCASKNQEPSAAGAEGWKTAPAVSGARLRAKFVAGGGVRELVGFHDLERNEDCTFRPAEEGRTRCLPPSVAASSANSFSDPACQVPLVSGLSCGSEEKYAITYRYDGSCGLGTAELRKLVSASGASYAQGPTGCTLRAAAPALAPVLALGEVVPWSSFVEGVETVIPGDPVAEKVLLAPDGARQHLGFRIERLDADCSFQLMADGITRCIPEGSTGPVIYSDSDCTKASFVNDYQSGGQCVKASHKLWLEPATETTCGGIRAVYSLRASASGSAPDDPANVYSQQLSGSGSGPGTLTCRSTGGGGGGSFSGQRSIEANLTPSLPSRPRISSGSGRLVPALVWSSASTALELGWHDSERDIDCTFTVASDGKLRCLPTGAEATLFFTDTACKSPSQVAVLGQVPCAGGARFGRATSKTCPVTTRVYALGTETRNLTSASAETAPGRCPTFPGVNNAIDATLADPAGFVEGVPVTE